MSKKLSSRHFSRREMLKLLGVGSAGLLLAACTPTPAVQETEPATETETASETASTPAEGGPTNYEEGELKVFVCCYNPPEIELREKFNTDFQASHPGAEISMELLPAGQNYFEKLQTLIAAGTPPDVFDMWEGYIQPYAANGVLRDLDPFFEVDDQVSKDDLLPAAVQAGSWQDHVYAFLIGFMPGPVSLYYNVDHFDQAGIDYPSPDWTWDDMRTAGQALSLDQNGDGTPDQWGLAFDLWFVPWLYWIWSNGGDVFNADETQCTLTDAKSTEALQYWADLVLKDNIAIPTSELRQMQGPLNTFLTGLISMYLGNTWDIGQLKEAQDLNWKGVLSPTANDGNRVWYEHLWCWGISSESKMANLGWLYSRDFVLNRTIDPATATIPPLKQLLPTFDTDINKDLGYEPLISLATEPNKFRIPGSGAKWDKISSIIQSELDLVFIGEKTAVDAATTVAPKVDEELARTG